MPAGELTVAYYYGSGSVPVNLPERLRRLVNEMKMVPFHGDVLQATSDDRGVWVGVRRVCESLGIAFDAQRVKLRNKPWAVVTTIVTTGSDGKKYEMLCLHLDSVPMWLATLDTNRVTKRARPKMVRYQCDAARVLRDAMLPHRATAPVGSSVVHGARIGDTPEGRSLVKRCCQNTAAAAKLTIQWVMGYVRRKGHTPSPYSVALCDWRVIETELDEIAKGKLVIKVAPKRLPAHDPRQCLLFQ